MTTTETAFLSGKVLKRTLPALETAEGPEAPVLKRLLLPQGELAQFYDADDPVRYVAYIQLREASVRGNHFHKAKEEWLYLIQGEALLVVEDVASKARDTVPLRAGDLAFIRAGVAHALKTIKAGGAVEFSGTRFNPGDTHRYPIA